LGLAAPDFGDADEAFEWDEADPEPLPVNDPTSVSMYFRDKEGTLNKGQIENPIRVTR